MHPYRTHTCGELRADQVGQDVRLSGWIHRKRDHGQLLFLDLRDHYGITQCVLEKGHTHFKDLEALRIESVITLTGTVVARSPDTRNTKVPTGDIEISLKTLTIHSAAEQLPILVASDEISPEDLRLKYRFIDLRREKLHRNIMLRSQIIASLRKNMTERGFMELQTPILTASSPEGARDFLVPSRLHPGKFYALPQAPQQFKQLAMVAGFDRYFQIAPCFRDEDTRADRVLEFYQMDMEMSFVTQDDVLEVIETVIHNVFVQFAGNRTLSPRPWARIPYQEALLKYGSDKPDLRSPLIISDVTNTFKDSGLALFTNAIAKGSIVRAIPAPGSSERPRSWFDKLGDWAKDNEMMGLGYIIFEADGAKGPLAKNLDPERLQQLKNQTNLSAGDSLFFVCDKPDRAAKLAGKVRLKISEELTLIEPNVFRFCWIVDFPMYERDDTTGKIDFCHNPFSMPQGGMEALNTMNPLDIKAFQYDPVCNGFEIGSGAIRNHRPDILFKAFEIVGYDKKVVEERFGGMLRAFQYGAPPHGGCAPGIDRIVMLLADEPNLREVILFPINQRGEDLMMGAPSTVDDIQLKELHLKLALPPKKEAK